ncbi:hypothetical protein [Chachezhania antarctica]|uniref:hypothetical protein n=1 Tax=Chachezhania antarctica TaxID=2340860 RepID=UPI0013CEED2F|nr:hypothetical protein [Chachezhania antarctica]|tara:strand:+ start:926 stop:1168 length:243 start_codon:yes stop_codon:yes gene_type:complete
MSTSPWTRIVVSSGSRRTIAVVLPPSPVNRTKLAILFRRGRVTIKIDRINPGVDEIAVRDGHPADGFHLATVGPDFGLYT